MKTIQITQPFFNASVKTNSFDHNAQATAIQPLIDLQQKDSDSKNQTFNLLSDKKVFLKTQLPRKESVQNRRARKTSQEADQQGQLHRGQRDSYTSKTQGNSFRVLVTLLRVKTQTQMKNFATRIELEILQKEIICCQSGNSQQ